MIGGGEICFLFCPPPARIITSQPPSLWIGGGQSTHHSAFPNLKCHVSTTFPMALYCPVYPYLYQSALLMDTMLASQSRPVLPVCESSKRYLTAHLWTLQALFQVDVHHKYYWLIGWLICYTIFWASARMVVLAPTGLRNVLTHTHARDS